MTKDNTAAVEFHRCFAHAVDTRRSLLLSCQARPTIRSTPWAPGAEATYVHAHSNWKYILAAENGQELTCGTVLSESAFTNDEADSTR